MNQILETYNIELFFDLSADLFFIAGYDGYFKKVNESAITHLGYTEDELYSKPIIFFIHEDDREMTIKNRENIKKGFPLLNFENRYVTKKGEIIWLSWTSMPLNESKLIYAVAKDITHKKKLEQERNELLTNLRKINNSLKKLTYTASHDMRSPVNNLLAVFELLDTSKIEDEETLEFVDMIKVASTGLKETLNNYVDNINHNENINQKLETLFFEDSLKNVLKSIKSLIKNSNAKIESDFEKLEYIDFNKVALESIFLNLITNSIKYATIDSKPIISITTKQNNGVNQLIYKDNGQGFDLKNIKHKIFELNQKFHNNTDSKGIGLYLVHQHINEMGGTIDIESEINKGTTFTISFKE
jgi:PAS domain S-box-containing protein